MRTFKSNTYSKRSMDRKTAEAIKKEKAAQEKVEDRNRSADDQREKEQR